MPPMPCRQYIKKEELLLKTPAAKQETHKLEKDKIGVDKKVTFKPNTIMEFLNGKRK